MTWMKMNRLQTVTEVTKNPVSLDEPPVGQEGKILGELVADSRTPSPEEITISRELLSRTLRMLGRLSDRERKTIRLRFGIGTRRTYTLEEVGKRFGLTRERVRQIEAKALKKLRASRESDVLKHLLKP